MPHLTKIAHLDFDRSENHPAYLLPGIVIWFDSCGDVIVVRVWDYQLNHSITFFTDVDLNKVKFPQLEVLATKTAVIILCPEAVLIWAIPSLLPRPPDFSDDSGNPTLIPPLFTIPFPDGIVLHSRYIRWKTIRSWYFESSQPLYFDMLRHDLKLHRFKIILEPDLSTASLHVVNTSEFNCSEFDFVYSRGYRICEDTVVTCWPHPGYGQKDYPCGVYMGSTSTRYANVTSSGGCHAAVKMLIPDFGFKHGSTESSRFVCFCPASGRFVYFRGSMVAVHDVI